MYRDHHSQVKWAQKLNAPLNWNDIWNTVHNFLSSNVTKTVIWQQLHLNFYTQYSYNKWHRKQVPCTLCSITPDNIYHLILHCHFTNTLWSEIEPCIKQIHPLNITEEEKAFGIVKKKQTVGILLRNWVTYLLRDFISKLESTSYRSSKIPDLQSAKHKFNAEIDFEIKKKIWRYRNDNNLALFEKFFTHRKVLCSKREDDEYEIQKVFP